MVLPYSTANHHSGRSMQEMKTTAKLLLLLGLAALSTGCASPYMVDRGRDAADILTVAVGKGWGVKARVGPILVGEFHNRDTAGLRGGVLLSPSSNEARSRRDRTSFLPGGYIVPLWYEEVFRAEGVASLRHKEFSVGSFIPFTSLYCESFSLTHLTQVEAAAGLFGTLRLGFNPGELLDFILGWTTIDIYNDDLEWKKRTSNKALDDTGE